jgi:hypothetical protein
MQEGETSTEVQHRILTSTSTSLETTRPVAILVNKPNIVALALIPIGHPSYLQCIAAARQTLPSAFARTSSTRIYSHPPFSTLHLEPPAASRQLLLAGSGHSADARTTRFSQCPAGPSPEFALPSPSVENR